MILMKKKKGSLVGLIRGLLLPAVAAAVLLFFAAALNSLDDDRETESLRQLEEALRRSCVSCYSAEGIYPPDLEYLKKHYGIQINDKKYTVHYSAFAENLMPDITVLENSK